MASLNHCVPDHVMWNAYGQDDIAYLHLGESVYLNTIPVTSRAGKVYHLPLAVVENEVRDLTTFTHKKPSEWREEERAALKEELTRAFVSLRESYVVVLGGSVDSTTKLSSPR
jgi:hypothetical protein